MMRKRCLARLAPLATVLFTSFVSLFITYGRQPATPSATASLAHIPIPPTAPTAAEADSAAHADSTRLDVRLARMPPLPPEQIDTETLWLARCIYSETKKPQEQELVAWVVRNRVETGYRGQRSYRGVVLDPYQFSAFNPESAVRSFYAQLELQADFPGWQTALKIAHHVRFAEAEYRPFPVKTRHFYSERSMVGRRHPIWAEGHEPITPGQHDIDERRFRFFAGIF